MSSSQIEHDLERLQMTSNEPITNNGTNLKGGGFSQGSVLIERAFSPLTNGRIYRNYKNKTRR